MAQSLDLVGDWWSIMLMLDALEGFARFDDFLKAIPIAPSMLTRRLRALVAAGLLERRRYQDHPPRYEYVPTDRGRSFRPVVIALADWHNRTLRPEDRRMVMVDTETGREVAPLLVDAASGERLDEPRYRFAAGRGAGKAMTGRMAKIAKLRGAVGA